MDRTDAPGPLCRRGPRPLLLHLTLAMRRSPPSPSASPGSRSASPHSSRAAGAGPDWTGPDRALIAGIAAYRRHPFRRDLAEPPARWREGGSRLLDYAPASAPGADARGAAQTALFVPSLVNRAYVLDLAPGRSMLRWLAQRGIRPLLLDWGWPGQTERAFTLTDYVVGRLERALEAAARLAGGPLAVIGYCMGGTLAVALAERRPDLVAGLGLLAAPWDFHAGAAGEAILAQRALALLEPVLAFNNTLPVDALQTIFAMLDPDAVANKYRAFARLDPSSERARQFVALEDWLNDGIPLAAPVARECLGGWYGANSPANGAWRIAGAPVDPSRLAMPALIAVPARDRIVPPGSALALGRRIPRARLYEPEAGHIGMVAGANAEASLWQTLAHWLATL